MDFTKVYQKKGVDLFNFLSTCLHFEATEHGRRQSEPIDDEILTLVRELSVGRGQLTQLDEGGPLFLLLGPQIHVLHIEACLCQEIQGVSPGRGPGLS